MELGYLLRAECVAQHEELATRRRENHKTNRPLDNVVVHCSTCKPRHMHDIGERVELIVVDLAVCV